nr:LamG domain-containing protein [Paenibacillus harenae]
MVFDPAIKVSEIRLGLTEKRISAGNAFTSSSVSVSPAFAGNQVLVWSSADPSIATVDEISGQVTAVKAGSTTITATATDGSGTAASYTLYILDEAIAYYTFDGSLLDSTGYGTGTATGNRANNTGGTITYSDGVSGQAAELDGSSGIRLPNGLISGYTYTVSMSVYLEQASQYTSAFFGSATPDSWISLAPRGPGDAQPTMLWSGSAWYNASTGIQIPTGTWVDLAFTVDNGTVAVYVDGVAKYTGASFPNVFTKDDGIFALGVNYWDNPFIGKIDELRIYDKALTADQIQTLSQ